MQTTKTQNQKLETFLRGTGRTITAAEAGARFGIMNLRARMSELRSAGLDVRTSVAKTTGKTKYSMPIRNIWGSKARAFA